VSRLGTAYAVVQVLMPARVAISVAAAPWFARVVVEPLRKYGRRRWKMFTAGAGSIAAAVGAGQYFGRRHGEESAGVLREE
jgi:peptidoglycan/LPS O-acetylase OafA/YrhL